MVRVGYKKSKKVKVRQKIFLGDIFFLQWYIQGYLKMVWQQTRGGGGARWTLSAHGLISLRGQNIDE